MALLASLAVQGQTPYEDAADYIIRQAGNTKGYCIDFGAGNGQLSEALAARSDLKIVGIDDDGEQIAAGRRALYEAGVYGVAFQGEDGKELRSTQVAVNLVDAAESVVAPADELTLEDRKAEAVDEAIESNRDVWKLVAIAALVFVMLEWWLYNRRVFI